VDPTRIAYVDSDHGPTTLWTALPDGSERKKAAVASGAAVPYNPAWSRNGTLAFLDGKATVGILSGSGTQKVKLRFAEVSSLAWSPDGARFVVAARARLAASFDVYTIGIDGSGLRRLTLNMNATSPSWR
jgi:Tol biopolymer transport system component